MTIIKRDGTEVEFDTGRISTAILKAMEKTALGVDFILAENIAYAIEKKCRNRKENHVEEIQDMVEEKLMQSKRKDVAKKYISYRNLRTEEREKKSEMMTFISDVIDLNNLENENANMPEWVFTAKKERIVGEWLKKYAINHLLSKKVRDAYFDGSVYIHDLQYYALGLHNCTTIDLYDILQRGFETHNGDVRTPTCIRSAMQLTAVILQCQSNVQFGGIAVASLDYDLAPYVKMSFKKYFKSGLKYIGRRKKQDIDRIMDTYTIEMSNKELEEKFPLEYEYAHDLTVEETEQSAEALIHNLNTLQSRSGDQLPFTSVNYGTDTSMEGRLIVKSMLKARMKGIGKKRLTPIFPIAIFKHKKGINDIEGTPNYDLKLLAIECASKRIYPNFANLDAPHLAEPVNKHLEFCTMGCRTALGIDRHGLEGYTGRGNASPVTMNLTKIGLDNGIALGERTEADLEGFWKQLDETIDITIKALVDRFEWQGKQLAKSAPFTYENQILKHHRKLEPNEPVREVLKHQTLAIGYLGLSNMLVALFGKHHGEDEETLNFALKVVEYIDKKAKIASDEYDLNFSCYATPAEGLCRKMLVTLREQYGIVEGVTDREYVNNSHHVPVYHNISIKEKIDIEAKFAKYATGGNITYVELDGNARQNLNALEDIVNYAMDKGVTYLALNHPIDACMDCGYEGIIGNTCPVCGGVDGEIYIKRLRRVTGYITSSYKEFFNEGKRQEVEDRVIHSKHTDFEELINGGIN